MEERDDVNGFLKRIGMSDQPGQSDHQSQWDKVIQPNSSYLIVGDVGTGKSALAYYLLETFGQKYNLLPAVVGLPRNKQELLPSNFIVLEDPCECTQRENIIAFIDETDIQLPIEDTKAREYVTNFLSLPRHRHQIFLLAFHFPRLVMGRYLPFFSAFLIKRPPYLLEFASKRKGDALHRMMERAEERFAEFPGQQDVVKHTYVVAPRIRWQGMLPNPLASFWNQGLSEIWAGAAVDKIEKKPKQQQLEKWAVEEIEEVPAAFRILPHYKDSILVGFRIDDPEGSVIRKRANIVAEIHQAYPEVSIEELENASVTYSDYLADVELRS